MSQTKNHSQIDAHVKLITCSDLINFKLPASGNTSALPLGLSADSSSFSASSLVLLVFSTSLGLTPIVI